MNPVCHILVAGDKAAYDLFEAATSDWSCPIGLSGETGRAHLDWHPQLDDLGDALRRRLQHRVCVVVEDKFHRGLAAVTHLRREGLALPVLLVLESDATNEDARAGIAAGASEVVHRGLGGKALTEAIERAVVRAHRATAMPVDSAGVCIPGDSGKEAARVALSAGDGHLVWSRSAGTLTCSPAALVQTGLDPGVIDVALHDWLNRVHEEDRARVSKMLDAVEDGILPRLEAHYRLRFGPGGHRWMMLRGHRRGDGCVVMLQTDVTAGSLIMGEVAAQGLSDELTGLATRGVLLARTAQCVAERRKDESYLFAVVALDLDRFARINNSLGHVIGDELLKGVAKRLLKCVRTGDLVARTGSDDFAMLLTDIASIEDAEMVVGRVSEAMSHAFELAAHQVRCSFSAGIVIARSRYDRPEELLRDASLALRRARSGGGDRSEVFETGMHMSAVNHQLTEILLRRGIASDQLRLHYQPLIGLKDGRQTLAGFEALVRWEHPTRGLLLPGTFIPIAEDSDLIVELGAWVLEKACTQAAPWLASRELADGVPVVVNVNIGARHFNHPSILQDVAHALGVSGIAPSSLQLEITESGLMDHVGIAIPNVERLRELGVGVQMDDFGTGYSSLSYLTQLSVSALKVDRAFTTMLPDSKPHGQIVEAIVSLARILDLKVTAEGVETAEQLGAITELGCDIAQGLYLGGPIPADEVEAWMATFPSSPAPR